MTQENTPKTPEAVVERLRALRAEIPDYSQLTIADAASLRRASTVDEKFVQASINAIGASDTVRGAIGRTPDVMREEIDEIARWTAVEDELRAMLKGVMAANLTRRHRLGRTALQAYHISRQLVRQPEHGDLLPHVQEMKRLLRFGRGRSRGTAASKTTTPQSQPGTQQPMTA